MTIDFSAKRLKEAVPYILFMLGVWSLVFLASYKINKEVRDGTTRETTKRVVKKLTGKEATEQQLEELSR